MRLHALFLLIVASPLGAQPSTVLPVPRAMEAREGRLTIDSTTRFVLPRHRDARLERAARRAIAGLARQIGQPLRADLTSAPSPGAIVLDVAGAGQKVQGIDENESYRLDVGPSGATVRAQTTVGAIRALETLQQLVSSDSATFYLPAVAIDDAPRFPWRGLLVDVSRHFMPFDQVKRTLDGMAMVKLNVFHWHLTDDQGFRVESKRFPRLHQLGSDGNYYTQDQIRDVVAYAADRGIRVVPEFDMPGHSTSWFVGYPQYSAQSPPITIRREWGGADAIFDPTREATYTFIAQFIAEMVKLFPDPYWHIGGDEVEGKHWNSVPRIVAWRRSRGLRTNGEMQAHFNTRLAKILARHDRRMIGWDEVLHPDLPPRTIVQSWRGSQYLADGVKRGHPGILSAPWYLDHIKPATEFYLADPVPQFDQLTPAERALVLGGEACMWAEYITAANADSRIWPRLGAVAERLWSPREVTDVPDMYRRLDILAGRLEGAGLRVRTHSAHFLRTLAPGRDVSPIESLFVAVQPPSFGQTMNGRRLNQHHPLTRLPDAARPDPAGRWTIERLVRRVVQAPGDTAARDSLATMLTWWTVLPERVDAVARTSPTLAPARSAAAILARTSLIGLEALGFLTSSTRPPATWSEPILAELTRYEKTPTLLRVVIIPDIRKLVTTAAGVTYP